MGTNTGIGIGIGIPFKNNALGGDRPYLPPELKARLIGVWDNYGKKNTDADRNIIKNKIPNAGGDLEILNAAYEGMSGCNGYPVVFGSNKTWEILSSVYSYTSDVTSTTIHITRVKNAGVGLLFSYVKKDGALTNIREIPAFRVTVKGLEGNSKFGYRYLATEDATRETLVYLGNGTHELSKSFTPTEALLDLTSNAWVGIFITPMVEGEVVFDCDITIEVLPEFEGAFVTDGVDDLITSTKIVQEMGITDEITVVSMIHQIDLNSTYTIATTNYIENSNSREHVRSDVYNYGKTGIYGYSASLINNTKSDIKNILGDEADYYVKSTNSLQTIFDAKFSVVGRISELTEASQVAWYWTIIANKVLTTDQINQVIAYFNLDRTLNPDILCDVKKQGITNENHAEFGDKLIDFSGNGRDIQLNNIAWDGDSGIGKYNYPNWKVNVTQGNKYARIVYYDSINGTYSADFKGITDLYKSYGLSVEIRVNRANTIDFHSIKEDGIYTITPPDDTTSIDIRFGGENVYNASCDITITQIPSHAGGLCLDGVNDFGKVTGMPIYKDYTIIADYERFYLEPITGGRASILSKSSKVGDGSFIFNLEDQDGGKACYTFGGANGNISDDITRIIRYQSKYYNTKTLSIGTAEDNDFMVLGKVREVDSRHFYGVIYSLMTFPYSMSEFLIERQLKKHKLGTLYPDMVEFRPVIKSNVLLDAKPTFVIRGTSTYLNAGDYVPENSRIWVSIKMNNIADRITKFTVNGKTIDIPENAYSEVTLQYGFPFVIDKSPQKISITIEQDENYVKFEPVITSNVEYHRLDFYLNNYQKIINIGDYIPKDAYLRANIYLNNNVDELTAFIFNGVNIGYRRSSVDDTAFNISHIYNYDSPQEVNITIDEYIRFEDIVQPYPTLLRFNDENGNEVSWGGKFKVGSTITRIGSIADPESNLLNGLYSISGLSLNGKAVTSSTSIVEKQMVFKTTTTYLLDNNEPKCILSPSRLRIPNSSYKILGYIPDISGHGNHGVIHNSAYAGASGANGYLQNFSGWTKASGVSSTDSVISSSNNLVAANGWIAYVTSGTVIPTFKVEISGIPINGNLRFEGSGQTLVNGVNTIQGLTTTKISGFYISSGYDNDWSNLRIEQVGEYEGAYCLDGVDDFITIPTTVGGKQVLMKVNSRKSDCYLYDQRNNWTQYLGIVSTKDFIAYNYSNQRGKTYIDGILNENITANDLIGITHNITVTNNRNDVKQYSPCIGTSFARNSYAQMALYDFMLFDNISTDDKIKELNEYVGIEAKVELPPYYWDTYGKTNFDADKATIQQRGVAVGDYDLTNTNFAYDKMSGFGGYEFEKFTDTTKWIETKREDGIEVIEKNDYSFTAKKVGTGQYFWDFKNNSIRTLDKELTVKAVSNNNVSIRWEFKYRTAEKPDIDSAIVLVKQAMTPNVPITVTLPYKTQEEQTELGVVEGSAYYLFYFDPSDIPVGDEYTVEMLPLYPNGLLYDGVTDYSKNANIPALDDFTAIIKRGWLKKQGCPLIKGSKVYEGGNGNALLLEWDKAYNFVFYKRTDIMEGELPDNISFITPTNYNGNVITRGSEQDTNGICIAGDGNAGFANMVFYKLILYPKTIPLLQINFLKNLMERDEIIDLNNPIFIKNE